MRGNGDVVGKGTINGRSAEETDIGTQVVTPGATLITDAVRDARLNRHAFTDSAAVYTCPDPHNHTCRLMAKNERLADNIRTNPPMLIIMDIRATDADGLDLDKHIVWANLGHRSLFQTNVIWGVQNCCLISHRVSPLKLTVAM